MAAPWEKYGSTPKPEAAAPWARYGTDDFASRAASMAPMDLSIARAKNDAFGEYLRNQAMQPREGETEAERTKRLYGELSGTERPGTGEGMARAGLQGSTFGLGDEIVAAGAAALDPLVNDGDRRTFGERYDAYLGRERGDIGKFREDSPYLAYGSEIAGAIPTSMLPGLQGWRAAQGAGLGSRVLAGAGTGALQGGVYGFNAGEDGLGGRLSNAAWGAGVGGVTGAVTPAIIDSVAKTLRYLGDQTIGRMGKNAQSTAALRKAAQALIRDGLTPEDAAARIRELGPEGALMDVGKNTRALASSTARTPGAGGTIIDDFVTARQEGTRGANNVLQGGQIERIGQSIDDLVPGQYGVGERAALEAARRGAAQPLYQKSANVASNLIPEEQFAQVMDDPFLAREFAKVKANKLYGMADLPDNSLTVVDAVKKSLDDQVSAAKRAGNNNAARLLQDKVGRLIDMADEAFPDYGAARQVWADYSGVIDAGDLGRKFMRGDVDVVADAVRRMSPEEAAQFRVGAAQALRDRIGGLVTRADATKKIGDIPALEQKIRVAFGDDDLFRRYIDMLDAERAMFDTYAAVKGGSQTAERMLADADAAVDPGALMQAGVDLAHSPLNPVAWWRGAKALSGNAGRRAAMPESVREELARALVSRNTEPLNQTMSSQLAAQSSRDALARALTTSGAVTGARNGAR